MKIYRLCKEKELKKIFFSNSFKNTGNYFIKKNLINTHEYKSSVKYLHFFKDINDVLFINPEEGMYIYEMDLDSAFLKQYFGYGFYRDLLLYDRCSYIEEYAIDERFLNIDDVCSVHKVVKEITKRDYIERNIEFCIENVDYKNKKYAKIKKK